MAVPLKGQPLFELEKYKNSMKEAIKLYINNDLNNSNIQKLKKYGYDLTTLEGLKRLLRSIYLYKY